MMFSSFGHGVLTASNLYFLSFLENYPDMTTALGIQTFASFSGLVTSLEGYRLAHRRALPQRSEAN
jgi:hypothetical protein